MECKRCGNTDKEFFYKGEKGWYCRRCARFKRILLSEESEPKNYEVASEAGEYRFGYELTPYQKEASRKTLETVLAGRDVLLNCVTGAGKTEISVEALSYFLKAGRKVCYAIARKEVVIDLEKRFIRIFPFAEVTALYGGHHDKETGDLIISTTHQLYRFYKTFDLLVIDEADAFPLDGDEALMAIAINAAKGQIIFSTATLSPFLMNVLNKRDYETVSLLVRPSLKPMIIPRVIYSLPILIYLRLLSIMIRMKGQIIVFVDRKDTAVLLHFFFRSFLNCSYVYSDFEERDQQIQDFKDGKTRVIFSTTVLERGVTIPKVSAVILFDHSDSFKEAAITQMAGRVGRGVGDIEGECIIMTCHVSAEIKRSLMAIREANDFCEMSVLRK